MKIVLRLIALWHGITGVAVVITMILILTSADGRLGETGRAWLAFGLLSLLGPVGIVSGIQLMRLRESGRKAALVFIGTLTLFAMAQYRKPPQLNGSAVLKLGLMVASIAVLVSERAQRVCGRSALGQSRVEQVDPPLAESQSDGSAQ